MEKSTETAGFQGRFGHDVQDGEFSVSPEAMHDQLDAARRDWAAMSAKRQRRLFDRRIHGYNATQERYDQLVIECQKLDMADVLQAETDYIQRRLMTAEYWLNEQNLLREETKKTVEGKKTWKFAHAFSEFLNSGSTRMRIAKGVALGFGIGIAGTMLGGVFGAATIGTGIVVAGRFARGYFARHKGGIDQHGVGAEDMLQSIGDEDLDDAEFQAALQQESKEMFNRDGKKEQNKQRIAFAWGAGSVAVGAAAGWAIAGGHWGFLPSAHAETVSHTDTSVLHSGHTDVTHVIDGHIGHSDVSTINSDHTDISHVIDSHTDASITHTGHTDISHVIDNHSNTEVIKPETFTVEKGSGFTREIYQYAQHLGYKDVDMRDSYKMYQIILESHGKNGIINVHDIAKDTYLEGKDVRISMWGKANWRGDVGEDLQRLFQAHENGHKLSTDMLKHHTDVSKILNGDVSNATATDIANADHTDVSHVLGNHTDASVVHETAHVSHTNVSSVVEDSSSNATAADIRHTDASVLNVRGTSVVAEAEQIIRQGANNPVNVVSTAETWQHTFSELNKAGLTIPKENYSKLLNVVGPELAKLHYSETIPVAYYDDFAHQWMMNASPNKQLLPEAVRVITKHLTKDGYVLAA